MRHTLFMDNNASKPSHVSHYPQRSEEAFAAYLLETGEDIMSFDFDKRVGFFEHAEYLGRWKSELHWFHKARPHAPTQDWYQLVFECCRVTSYKLPSGRGNRTVIMLWDTCDCAAEGVFDECPYFDTSGN